MNISNKLTLFFLLTISILSCNPEPKDNGDGDGQETQNAAQNAPEVEVIKSTTIAEGVMVGLRGNELQLDGKASIMLPEEGNDSVVTVFILRPAETMGVKTSLSARGQIRANLLARTFAKTGIDRIYCEGNAAMQTALMTSRENACDLGLVKNEGTDELSKTILKNFKGKKIMVVGSPRMMTDVLDQLAGPGKFAVSSEDLDQIYVVIAKDMGDAEVHHLRY